MSTEEDIVGPASFLADFSQRVPATEVINQLQLFQNPLHMARQYLLTKLYLQILGVPGQVAEFGCRYGKNIATFAALRRTYEVFESRMVVGFDTFHGLPSKDDVDGEDRRVAEGEYNVPEGHFDRLVHYFHKVLKYKNLGLIEGDVRETWPEYLEEYPESMIALAYFDLDLYGGTVDILPSVWERMPAGAILVMDELNCRFFPGETVAVQETIGLELPWKQDPSCNYVAWTVKGAA